MKLYTKTGDAGNTKLVGGRTVSKASERVASYGTIDELNSWLGYLLIQVNPLHSDIRYDIEMIQQVLFDCGTDLATPDGHRDYRVDETQVTWLEDRIDMYAAEPPLIEQFIIPGGTLDASLLHIARTTTRRAERHIVGLMSTDKINAAVLRFVNRLSDYFYAVARAVNARQGTADVFYQNSDNVFHNF